MPAMGQLYLVSVGEEEDGGAGLEQEHQQQRHEELRAGTASLSRAAHPARTDGPTRPAQGPGGLKGLGQELGGDLGENRPSASRTGCAWHTCGGTCTRAPVSVRAAPCPACSPTGLTVSRRHLFSLMAPMQPTKPMAITKAPVTMSRLAADSDGKEEDRVAKFPCVAASQMPTPRMPQPPSWARAQRGARVRSPPGAR